MMSLILLLLAGVTPQLPLSIATTDDALAVFANPAGLGAGRQPEFYYLYNFQQGGFLKNNSFAASLGSVAGFLEPAPLRWGIGLGFRQDMFLAGASYMRDDEHHIGLGAMLRPAKWLSIGANWQDLNRNYGLVSAGMGFRPLGNRLTLFAETFVHEPLRPAFGFQAEPVSGVCLDGRARITGDGGINFALGLSLSVGRLGVGAVATRNPAEAAGYLRLSSQPRKSILTGPKRVLRLELAERVADTKPGFSLLGVEKTRTLWSLLELVRQAKEDRAVRAMVLKLDEASMDFAHAQEVRQALLDFKSCGKKLYVHAHQLNMLSYYLASAADRIVLHPMGGVQIPGISGRMTFLKGALEKLGIEPEATRHGKYKSAVEQFTEDSLTGPNREQLQALVDALYEEFVAATATGRGATEEEMETLVGRAFFMAHEARSAGLVDTLCYDDELDSLITRELGRIRITEKQLLARQPFKDEWLEGGRVALIYASGSIATGESHTDFLTGDQVMGSRTMVKAIREARRDSKVKAILLRVDSPGGDGFASDEIWRELELTRNKKPLVVSMGGLAASGGYYISCNARRVFANPTTITGSIGVFSLRLVTEGLYNKIGMRRQSVKRGEHADMTDARRMTPEEDSIVQAQIDYFYKQFVEKVAQGRGLTFEQVDSVGQGRVWAGRDARLIGLVDSLGGLREALHYARREARLNPDCRVEFYPKPKSPLGLNLDDLKTALLLKLRPW
ncbi:MAG: signal peptide peptidase SppA [candidate division WOR-3 bacterium]